MPTNYIDSTADAPIIPEVWGGLALGYLPKYLNLGRTVATDSDLTPANEGDIIHTSKRGALSANQMSENGSVTVQKPSRTDITVTLNQHWEVTFGQLDFAKALSRGMSIEEYSSDAVAVLAEKMEDSLASLHTGITNTITSGGSSAIVADLLAVRERFVTNKVPKTVPHFGYVHQSYMTNILKTAQITDYDKTGQKSILYDANADVRFAGFSIFESQAVKATGSPVYYHNLFYTKNAMVIAMRPLPLPDQGTGGVGAIMRDANGYVMRVVKSWNSSSLANQITIDVLFGTAILDDRLIVELENA